MNSVYNGKLKEIECILSRLYKDMDSLKGINVGYYSNLSDSGMSRLEKFVDKLKDDLDGYNAELENILNNGSEEILEKCKQIKHDLKGVYDKIHYNKNISDAEDNIKMIIEEQNSSELEVIAHRICDIAIDIVRMHNTDIQLECVKIIGPILYVESTDNNEVLDLKHYMHYDNKSSVEKTIILSMYYTYISNYESECVEGISDE